MRRLNLQAGGAVRPMMEEHDRLPRYQPIHLAGVQPVHDLASTNLCSIHEPSTGDPHAVLNLSSVAACQPYVLVHCFPSAIRLGSRYVDFSVQESVDLPSHFQLSTCSSCQQNVPLDGWIRLALKGKLHKTIIPNRCRYCFFLILHVYSGVSCAPPTCTSVCMK